MLQLRNTSPFEATMFSMPDPRGVDALIVVIKASFELDGEPVLAAEQQPLRSADEYWGEPGTSSLRYPGELHLPKPGTDLIVLAEACAPHGQPVTELDVSVRVADRSKRVRVHGERMWIANGRHAQPSRPHPFVRVPIIYERAYGGPAEPRNPVGRGSVGNHSMAQLLEQLVPNIDDPEQPLAWLGQTPPPVGLAAVAPSWQPRVAHAGTFDERWRKQRAPYLPDDFDPRFLQAASPGLCFEHGLGGGEPIVLTGFDPERTLAFMLPRCELDVSAWLAGSRQPMPARLDTVLIDLIERRALTLIWRASLTVGEHLLRVERVDVGLAAIDGGVRA
jgi:hypothetical protein